MQRVVLEVLDGALLGEGHFLLLELAPCPPSLSDHFLILDHVLVIARCVARNHETPQLHLLLLFQNQALLEVWRLGVVGVVLLGKVLQGEHVVKHLLLLRLLLVA